MNTKVAIEYMENINKDFPCLYGYVHNTGIHEVIDLLRQGEEYKRILEHIGVISNNGQVNRIIRDTLLRG